MNFWTELNTYPKLEPNQKIKGLHKFQTNFLTELKKYPKLEENPKMKRL